MPSSIRWNYQDKWGSLKVFLRYIWSASVFILKSTRRNSLVFLEATFYVSNWLLGKGASYTDSSLRVGGMLHLLLKSTHNIHPTLDWKLTFEQNSPNLEEEPVTTNLLKNNGRVGLQPKKFGWKKKGIWLRNGKSSSLTSAILLVTYSFQIFKFLESMIELPFFIDSQNCRIHRMHPCRLVLLKKNSIQIWDEGETNHQRMLIQCTPHTQSRKWIYFVLLPTPTLKGAH